MAKKNVVIRLAKREKYINEILNLIRDYNRDDEKYAKRYYDKYFSGDDMTSDDAVFVAEMGGKVIGVIGYCRYYFSADYSYWLGRFVLSEEFRGVDNGNFAKKFFDKVEIELKGRGVGRLFVSTEDENIRAISFYVKSGFRFEARLRDFYYEGEDKIILSKRLAR